MYTRREQKNIWNGRFCWRSYLQWRVSSKAFI